MANPNWKPVLLRAALIAAAGFWVFSPALRGDWLMDDDMYVTQNALLNDPARLWKIWFAPGSLVEYYPIEATIQAIQWHLWHYNTLGYHLTNVILHLISALLVWRLFSKFGLRLAWLGGFLFAIHPALVESVAWISELKNTLSLPPFLLAMCVWIDYQERGRPRDYALALGLFFIAMLCKITMAPFPIVILLYAWWKRGRIGWRDLMTSAPFFAISFALGLATVFAGQWFRDAHLQATTDPDLGGFLTKLAIAGQSIAFYFTKCLWPGRMLPIYPKWPIDPQSPLDFLPWLVLAGVIGWLWSKRASWGRHALFGLGFFLVNLLPFVGFHSVSFMEFTWVMDHFLYIPIIGLIALVIAALEKIEDTISSPLRPRLAVATAVVLALLALQSYFYADKFIGPEQLWSYTIQYNPNTWLPYNNLGAAYLETGRTAESIDAYQKALQLKPSSIEANNNLGVALFQEGRISEAIQCYEKALKVDPHFALAHANLGNAFAQAGRVPEAIDQYQQALLTDRNNADARANLTKLQAQLNAPSP